MIQRYGEEVAGGAETLCRQTAGALADAGHSVRVHTTTARDYLTWSAHYPAGISTDGGVAVHRHAVSEADPGMASALVRRLALDAGDGDAEMAWARAQGPVAPGLVDAVRGMDAGALLVCWTYLYATTQLAMAAATGPAVLVPLAHNEAMLRFPITRGVMRRADGFAFMTPEEALLVDDLHGIGGRPFEIVGAGLAPARPSEGGTARAAFALPDRFALYLGRIDPAKGIDELLRAHAGYRARGGELGLVLSGRATVPMEFPDWVVTTGFVTEEQRASLIDAATCVLLPSRHESLSLVALEAWHQRTPTLANGHSEVLAGQTRRSGAGRIYLDEGEYARELAAIAGNPAEGQAMGTRGADFASDATWPACVARWERLLSTVAGEA